MTKIQRILEFPRKVRSPRLLLDLLTLSVRIALAVIIAAFRIIAPRSAKRLAGETVLITGAGHGIGRELAMQLSSLGCVIICWDIDDENNRSTAAAVIKKGGVAYSFTVDVSRRAEVRKTIRLMRETDAPDVSILINNAAVLHHKPFLGCRSRDIEETFNVNVLSSFWTIRAFLPEMLRRGRGHVVAISSMCGIYGVSQKVAYCSSKFALRGLMEALHEEVRLSGGRADVRFTTIYPFYVDTGLARDPKYRFPWIFGVITPQRAAREVIEAIRRDCTERSVPRCLFTLNAINRIVPEAAMRLILDFLADVDRKSGEASGAADCRSGRAAREAER